MGFIQQTPPTSIPPDTALTLVAIGLPERESCSTENCTSAAKRTVNNLKIALQLKKTVNLHMLGFSSASSRIKRAKTQSLWFSATPG